jgi:pimeloyl-ACP methyl ester carboxylesterase
MAAMGDFAVTLVLMPGMDGGGELLREFVAALPEGMVVETLRYPAEVWVPGREMAKTLAAGLPKEPFVLVAESYGTGLAVRLAGMRPVGLRGVVLCAGFCTSPLLGWKRWAAMRLAPALGHVGLPGWVVRRWLVGEDATAGLVEAVVAAVSWVEPKVLAARVREALRSNVLADLALVRVPVLYVQPTQDRVVDPECLEEIRRVKAGRTLAIDGPHLLMQTQPELVAEVVMGFVRELSRECAFPETESDTSLRICKI